MFKIGLIKSGIQIIAGLGTGFIVDNALDIVKPKNLTGLKKMAVKVGAFTMSAMAADKVSDYIEEKWDGTIEEIKDLVKPKEEVETEEETEAE